jgi:4-aminobutyrate aminotransferase/(S)-3-amino-2-methylpropionate transaminase
MNDTRSLEQRRRDVVPTGLARFSGEVTVVSAAGAHLRTTDGTDLIDFAGGIGVMNVGHCAEAVVAAVRDQVGRLIHACISVATYAPYVEVCEELIRLFPHGDRTKAMLVNSGAEAVENAVKIARQATGRSAIICYSEAFHGRTMLALSLTSSTKYKAGCGPFAPEIYRLPYPNIFRYGDGLDERSFVARELQRLRDAFTGMVDASSVAAIILEPVQGEGGFAPAPKAYLNGLREICDEFGILLIFDEVQSGFGRTGRWAAYEHAGVTPDLSTWAKSMGGGLPIGAVVGRADVMDAARPGTLGGTYGGNPLACAATLATIKTIEAQHLCQRSERIGQKIRIALERIQKNCPMLADIRGLGAMIGAEFCLDGDPHRPATAFVGQVRAQCIERGLLILTAGADSNILRFLAPLTIDDADLDRGLKILSDVILEQQI